MRSSLMTRFVILAIAIGLITSSVRATAQTSVSDQPASAAMPDLSGSGHGLDLKGMDLSVAPCKDFYRYANGKWLDTHPVPADKATYSAGTELYERNIALLHAILIAAAADKYASKDSDEYKVGTFYRTGMDTAKIESLGIRPLAGDFAQIAAIHDVPGLESEIAALHRQGESPAFEIGVDQDPKDSTVEIVQIAQGGLGLPDRDYYVKTDGASEKIRDQYAAHVAKMFTLLGDPPARAASEAATVMALETRLAKSSMTNVEQRDPNAVYHKLTFAEMDALTPGVGWAPYFTRVGVSPAGSLIVGQPDFFKNLAAMMTTVPLTDWKTYLRWQTVTAAAPYLSSPFVSENFAFYGTVLSGVKQQSPRWKRVQAATDAGLGEALGKLYIAKAFSPQAKARALDLVNNLKAALDERIATLDWMSDVTKAKARAKLAAYQVKIGYPDTWRDYSKLHIADDSYYQNVVRANAFEFQRDLDKLGKPVDRKEWLMTPATVNAYYNPLMNEIVFPAGILQPPLFDPKADDAVNYGAIGTIIGHEMTHGFDDEGRQFDAQGNLKDWWTVTDAANFKTRAAAIVKQYDGYVAVGDLHINGELTQGENIADIGGMKIAYLAFHRALKAHPEPALLDGLTPDQRFFIAQAQCWRNQARPEAIRQQILTDPHSPHRFRVIGPLADMPELAQAFHCAASETAGQGAAALGVW